MIEPIKRLRLIVLAALPALVTLGLTFFSLSAKHMEGWNRFMPELAIIPIFYWGLVHARHMPYWFVFVLGTITDAVSGLPLGLSSLFYIFFLLILRTQRKYIYKEGFVIKWSSFAILLAFICVMNWCMLTLFYNQSLSVTSAFFQWLFTVCCYPLLHMAFDSLYEYIQDRRWQIIHGS